MLVIHLKELSSNELTKQALYLAIAKERKKEKGFPS